MNTRIDELEQLMQSEVELSEMLVDVMARKQRAILGLQSDALTALTRREEELMSPLHRLEEARAHLVEEILLEAGANPRGPRTVRELAKHLPPAEARRIAKHAARLRSVVERILSVNENNRVLLQRSQRFVHDTLRMITEDHTKQLVDHRI